jgi:hypothetical protein
MLTIKVALSLTFDSTSTLPPYNCTNLFTIPNPNPVPDVGLVEKNGSKI